MKCIFKINFICSFLLFLFPGWYFEVVSTPSMGLTPPAPRWRAVPYAPLTEPARHPHFYLINVVITKYKIAYGVVFVAALPLYLGSDLCLLEHRLGQLRFGQQQSYAEFHCGKQLTVGLLRWKRGVFVGRGGWGVREGGGWDWGRSPIHSQNPAWLIYYWIGSSIHLKWGVGGLLGEGGPHSITLSGIWSLSWDKHSKWKVSAGRLGR